MPLDRFVLLLISVICAAGLTIAAAVYLQATIAWPGLGLPLLVPLGLIAYVVLRVVAGRLRDAPGDRYSGNRR